MNKFLAHIKIIRPLNCSISAFTVIISASILQMMEAMSLWIVAIAVVVSYNAAANILNDYLDQETDKINQPNRVLITGEVKPNTALIMAIILFTIGTLLVFTLPSLAILIAVAIALPLMVFYSIWFKGIPLLGNIVISSILGLTFLFAGAVFGNARAMVVPAVLAFGLTIVRELVKDIADFKGDTKAGLSTLPTTIGIKKSWIVSAIFAILIGLCAIIPFLLGIYNYWYIIIVIFGVEIPLLITLFLMMKFPTIDTAKRSAKLLKFSTIAGVFSVWLGSF